MSIGWWARQARTLADPAGLAVAGRVMLERDAPTRVRRLRRAAASSVGERVRPSREKMRAIRLRPGGRLGWATVPAPPPPGPGGAVVRPLAVATCDMDRAIALGATPFVAPFCFGHECVAEIVSVGGDVTALRPGQRVVVPFQISCGGCVACQAGHTSNCLSVPPISMYGFGVSGGHWGGALAEQLAVPYAEAMLVPLPDGVEPVVAASVADNVCDAYRHVAEPLPRLLSQGAEARVLIIGAVSPRHLFTASVSLYAGLLAHSLGAGEVTLVDARADVLRQAVNLGLAAVTPARARRLPPAPLVIDTSAAGAGLRLAVSLTAPDGICTSSGSLHASARLPAALMFGRNVTVHVGRSDARTHIPAVLELIAAGRLAPERVTTAVADFTDAPAALREHVRLGSAKTIITATT